MSDNYSLSSDSEFERRRTYGGGSSDSEGCDPSTETMDGSGEEAEVAGAASGTTAGEDSWKTTLVLNPAMIDVYHKELVGQGLWERRARRDNRERYYLSDAQRTKMEPPSVKGCRISHALRGVNDSTTGSALLAANEALRSSAGLHGEVDQRVRCARLQGAAEDEDGHEDGRREAKGGGRPDVCRRGARRAELAVHRHHHAHHLGRAADHHKG